MDIERRARAGPFACAVAVAIGAVSLLPGVVHDSTAAPRQAAAATPPAPPPAAASVSCVSTAGEHVHCPAETSMGMVLLASTGSAPCDLGRTWGWDPTSVWVSSGCGGTFAAPEPPPAAAIDAEERSSWGAIDATGSGVLLHRGDLAELAIGGYALVRYINQLPAEQQFTDHLGNVHDIDARNDVQFHRAMLHFRGWLFSPKARFQVTVWSVMSTDQTTLYGFLGYQFHERINVYGGINSLGGSRSLMGSHPFWLANDRVMADEFFRPSFAGGVWVNGELVPGLWYQVAAMNNLSQLGITAGQLDRGFGTGATVWWMPTTHEFGPNGAYGDWEYHEQLATRFGVSSARSREDRQVQATSPENTQTKLADSRNAFDTGALAPGVTVESMDYRVLAFDAGIKYRGVFAQVEYYNRWLQNFEADGPLPVSRIHDHGFYVQAAFFPIRHRLEIYGATSHIAGDAEAGFGTSGEVLLGGNVYWFNSRNVRTNVQVMKIDRSPVNSVFGLYVGGQRGPTVSIATSFYF